MCKVCDNEGVTCRCKNPSVWCDKRVCHARKCEACDGKSVILVRDVVVVFPQSKQK